MADLSTEVSSTGDETYFHCHVRMEVELCFTVNTELVDANVFGSPFYQNMPEGTRQAYQQLLRAVMNDPATRRRLLATMAIERAWNLYLNEDDILSEVAPEENLVSDDGKRVELEQIVQPHLIAGAPYFWFKDAEANEHTFKESEAQGGLDTEPLHTCLDDMVCNVLFTEVPEDEQWECS